MRRCLRSLGLALGFLFLSLQLQAAQKDRGEAFRVCADPNNPPFSDQKQHGFENKLAAMLARELKLKVEYTWFPQRIGFIRNTLKAPLEDGEGYKCDIVMGVPTGYELAATTKSYYRSTYALLLDGRVWPKVRTAEDLGNLPADQRANLQIAYFTRTPGADWVVKYGLVERGIPLEVMPGDAQVNPADSLLEMFGAKSINAAIVWGPIAGYVQQHAPRKSSLTMIPLTSSPDIRFDFPVSMAVRHPDKERKEQLNRLLERKAKDIEALLRKYRVPLVDDKGRLLP